MAADREVIESLTSRRLQSGHESKGKSCVEWGDSYEATRGTY